MCIYLNIHYYIYIIFLFARFIIDPSMCICLRICICNIPGFIIIIIHTILSTQVRFYTLRRMALAFALIKQMLKLENSSKEACDFSRDLWIASRAATS